MRDKEAESSALFAQVCRQMNREFVLGPPLTERSPIPEVLAGVWIASRESLIAGPRVNRLYVTEA